MANDLTIRPMTRAEVDLLVDWAAREGWNPGLQDAEFFWATDPDAFVAADLEGELIGGGAITAYEDRFGFMGFFIVRPEFRGRGLGNRLWHARRDRLVERLRPGATIGMDGVFNMQPYYAKGGFVFSHRDIRFRAEIPSGFETPEDPRILPLAELPFEQVAAYDRTCFPAGRESFLRPWIAQSTAAAFGYRDDRGLRGYGVARRCRDGCKIGPLFADTPEIAAALYDRLSGFAAGGALFLDTPENNPAAVAFAQARGMLEVFGCARMYLGPMPDLAHQHIYGVTTFELG